MERLTRKDEYGYVHHPWEFNGINGSYDIWDEELLTQQIDRLAAYEDFMERWKLRSIEEANRIFQRVNVLGGTDLMAQYRALGSVDHLRDLLQAEQDRRLAVLLCKVGDTVYQIDAERVYASEVKRIIYDAGHIAFDERAIGKTVFMSREEAEAALAQKEAQ